MSKLSFRARALDASKPMPIYRSEEIPDLPDFAAINRAVPQMPTGMEKEEECEHHLQRAISAQQAFGHTGELVIPTPEVYTIDDDLFDELYPPNYKISRQLIHMQPFAMDQDIPDYDMDSEDEKWLTQQAKKMEINPLQFEEMMDRLEKGSGQQVGGYAFFYSQICHCFDPVMRLSRRRGRYRCHCRRLYCFARP